MTCNGLLPNHDAGTIKNLNLTTMGESRARSEASSAIQVDSKSWLFRMPDQVRHDGETLDCQIIRLSSIVVRSFF
jgi:hypothetical protein